jgi:hypothetical protein
MRTKLGRLLLEIGELFLELLQAVFRCRILLLAQGFALDFELHRAPLHLVELDGTESISMRSFDAASSIRSIALSGRNRSEM